MDFSPNKFGSLNDICQDCNNRTCVCDIASDHYSNLTVLNTESLSETENLNISVVSNKTIDSLSDPENTSDYENETVPDVSYVV